MRILALLVCLVLAPQASSAFSVLAHQAVVDRCWEGTIVPALRARFGSVRAKDLERARAFAYGGSHIADLGYFPFGSRLFTDLVHYVRSGDFVEALVEDAHSVDEYAFALGALAHYITDDTGHPEATNRVVSEIYPKLRKKHGERVTYADDNSAHLKTEFRFDVLQISRGKGSPDLFRHAIAFEVSRPALERAFLETYGLRLQDVFVSTDTAITTYRWGFRELVHEVTGVAWELYRADIQRLDPAATEASFVYEMPRADFEKEFGRGFRQPGYFARLLAFPVKLVPDVGPLKRMPYKPLPESAKRRFTEALDHATARYRTAISHARGRRLTLPNETLDTGERTRRGDYEPADEAYAALLEELEERDFANVSSELRAAILRFYDDRSGRPTCEDDDGVRRALRRLEATSSDGRGSRDEPTSTSPGAPAPRR